MWPFDKPDRRFTMANQFGAMDPLNDQPLFGRRLTHLHLSVAPSKRLSHATGYPMQCLGMNRRRLLSPSFELFGGEWLA